MFVDISHCISHNPPARQGGICVADIDGDGWNEFIVAGFGSPNRILKWVDGRLVDLVSRTLADTDRHTLGFAAGDIDGDGVEELYAVNADVYVGPKTFADRLFDRQPDGHWSDLFRQPRNQGIRNCGTGRCAATFDRRGTGRYGFFVANHTLPARHFELGVDNALADLAPALGLDVAAAHRGLLAAPLLGSRTDLLILNENGPNTLFRNRGEGRFEGCAGRLRLTDDAEPSRVAMAINLGNRFGLACGNWEGPHRLFVPWVDGGWKDLATPGFAFPSAVRSIAVADFDNDGHEEILFNNFAEANRLFRLGLAGDHESAFDLEMLEPGEALLPEGIGTGTAIADIDGDGVLELLVSHGEESGQPLSLFKARSTVTQGWLRVQPLTRFGAPARGAVVRADFGSCIRARFIDGGSGNASQMEPVAHFGLGTQLRVLRIIVTWPDGATLTLIDPDVNCTYVVPYPAG